MAEKIIRPATGLMKKINNFYDNRATPWYKEVAKHLVPSYTANRFSEINGILALIGVGIEVGKTYGYIAFVEYIASKI
jgi:hypothetical protein